MFGVKTRLLSEVLLVRDLLSYDGRLRASYAPVRIAAKLHAEALAKFAGSTVLLKAPVGFELQC